VLKGEILDVAVDIRKGSPTYGKYEAVKLSAENKRQLLVPKGFAHGFSVLSDEAEVLCKCDEFYHPEEEAGIAFDDPVLNIDWGMAVNDFIVSDKDFKNPLLSEANNNFTYK